MAADDPSANGQPDDGALPPVEPPSARFIVQLFLVPLILVGVFGAAIYFLFGWLGVGAADPQTLMDRLESHSDLDVRWMAAQDFAQVLPRDEALRSDIGAALRVCGILQREMQHPPPLPDDDEQRDFLKYLPGAVAAFRVPVGVPLLQEIVAANVDRLDSEGHRIRLYNALGALGAAGSRLKEYDDFPEAEKDRIRTELQNEAGGAGDRAAWARLALEFLKERQAHAGKATEADRRDVYGIAATLTPAVRAPDELTRKYAIVALGNWHEAGVEGLLRELTGENGDVTQFEDSDAARGRREIRSNAALALARRGSRLTPWHLVVEALDEDALRQRIYPQNNEMATASLLKAIRDLRALKEAHAQVLAAQPEVQAALDKLAESRTAVVQVEARKTLGGASAASKGQPVVSREFLLVGTFGAAIGLLLALAVIARWRRKSTAAADFTH
jgi:hypothetical protein